MKKTPLIFLFLFTLFYFSHCISIQQSDFCKYNCKCDTEKNIVECNKIKFDKHINTTSFWFNKEKNISYPFYKVSIQNASFNRIFQFPVSNLSILDLSKNRIEVIDTDSFKYLQNMVELDLSDNDITSELFFPDIFKGLYAQDQYLPLKSLKVLRLGNNGLHTLHQDMFEHISNLEVLDLHGNPLRIIDDHTVIAIGGLMNLRELDLSYTFLRNLPIGVFHSPRKLEKLDLSGNLLTALPTEQLEDARNLKYLSLNENHFVNITKEHGFPKLEYLKILHMCYMEHLARIEDGSLAGLWNVEELFISNNPNLEYIGDLALARTEVETQIWPKITKLHLNGNHISYLSPTFLAHWDLLVDLNVNDNPWTCDCENRWVLETLVPVVWKEHNSIHRPMRMHCAWPPELKEQSLVDLWRRNETHLRCLDMYGARPEKDAGILIGILIGLLLGIPAVLGILFCYKKNFFGYFNSGPAAFSRKFYNPATADDDDFIP